MSALLETIRAYQAGVADFNLNAPENDDAAEAYADVSYGPDLARLQQWNRPAENMEETAEALRISLTDKGGVANSEAATRMVQAAYAYVASRCTINSQASLGKAGGKHMTINTATEFDPSDIYYELDDLAQALEAIKLIVGEMSYATADGGRNHDLDRVYALIKISHREANRLHRETQIFDRPGTWKYVPPNGASRNGVEETVEAQQ